MLHPDTHALPEADKTISARRVIAGNCPGCGRVLVVLNNHEVWPLVHCDCGQVLTTHEITNKVRLETGARAVTIDPLTEVQYA